MKSIDHEQWREISTVLDAVLDLSESDRLDYLDVACAGKPELRALVESLLQADSKDEDFLETPAVDFVPELFGDELETESVAADAVPPYRIIGEVGRGGMGTVHLAERADGHFEQRVALKIVRGGLSSGKIADRFLRERQILAGLEHPNIARLLDGGVTKDGLPFFALEYVDGSPITRYADEKKLSVNERLRLFEQVCEAVRYAQTHLVVHRDLKPSNILVTNDGKVKLLDFGIAKLIDPEGEEGGDATIDGARAMTPEYAAPEQIRGETITTATDVYALGVVLYELLSGRRPYRIDSRTPGAAERAILEEVSESLPRAVERASKVTSGDSHSMPATSETVSENRRTTPDVLRKRLAGDLENIVAKALRKDSDRRYRTAEALLDDLCRHRQGLPILARPATFNYRARKYVSRHKMGVVSATVVALALLGGVAGIAWQGRIAAREAHRATRVKDFLISIFQEADPDRTPGEDVKASDILARGAARVRRELADEPEMTAELLRTIAKIYEELGSYGAAKPLAEEAYGLRSTLFGEDDPRTAETICDLGTIHHRYGEYTVAESLFRRALAIERRLRSHDDPRIAEVASNLAGALAHLGEYEEAERLYRETLAIDRQQFGDQSPQIAMDMNNLAVMLGDLDRLDEAEEMARQALRIRRARAGESPTEFATSLHNLGTALRDRGEFDEAESLLREAVEQKRTLYPDGHPSLGRSLRSLSWVLVDKDDLDGGERALEEAHAMQVRQLGPDHEEVGTTLNQLALLAYQRGDFDRAAKRLEESITIFRKTLPEDHPTVLTLRSNLATMNLLSGDLDAAERTYRELLEIRRKKFGDAHTDVGFTYLTLGDVARRRNDSEEAVAQYRMGVSIYENAVDADHVDLAWARRSVAVALADGGSYTESEELLRTALATYRTNFSDGHRRIYEVSGALGRTLTLAGRPEDALPFLEEAVAGLVAALPDTDARSAEARGALGMCLLALGREDEAGPILETALPALLAQRGASYPPTREAEQALGKLEK